MAHREHGGDLWGEVDVLIRGVGGWEPQNEWGREIDPQNPNIERASSISIWAWNFQLVHRAGTHRVA
jgi:hypothetical protein